MNDLDANELLNKQIEDVENIDVDETIDKLNGMKKGRLARIWDKIMWLVQLVTNPNATHKDKIVAAAALAYVVMPIDAIPDFIPVVGFVDDVAVVMAAIKSLYRTVTNRT